MQENEPDTSIGEQAATNASPSLVHKTAECAAVRLRPHEAVVFQHKMQFLPGAATEHPEA